MRHHRFYIPKDELELESKIWVKSPELRNQWFKVFRYKADDEVVLFDGESKERLYKILRIERDAAQLHMITEFERKLPSKHVYLFWSLLKKDKNEWVIQKCTELGVTNFVPIIAERSEKTGFNIERAEKIAIEASEQCGRSDIPHIREPIIIDEAMAEYSNKVQLFVAEGNYDNMPQNTELVEGSPVGVFIGPEGGWNENEVAYFEKHRIKPLVLGNLTLRAETAAVSASVKMLQ